MEKIIHQIWVGEEDPPIPWMQTWVDFAHASGWEYRVWTESTIPALENFKAYNYYEDRKLWHGMSDVARVEILERWGGWYIDADVELIDPIGFATDPMQEASFVVSAHPDPRPPHHERYPNTVMGSTPGNRILSRYVNMISRAAEEGDLEPVWATVGGSMLYRAIMQGDQPFHVLPAENFLPFNFGVRVTEGEPVYAIHHQQTTRQSRELPEYTVEDL